MGFMLFVDIILLIYCGGRHECVAVSGHCVPSEGPQVSLCEFFTSKNYVVGYPCLIGNFISLVF